jgi:hypothetical protein
MKFGYSPKSAQHHLQRQIHPHLVANEPLILVEALGVGPVELRHDYLEAKWKL